MSGAFGSGPVTPQVLSERAQGRLASYVRLLRAWNPAINLVSRGSLDDVWHRHVQDSLQLLRFWQAGGQTWLDLGSGAGFPGMIVAIALAELSPETRVWLVEADRRKAEFLRTVSRETCVEVTVLAERIERLPPLGADTLSARALAPLATLCGFARRHLAPDGRAIFPKGVEAESEIAAARQNWRFNLESFTSETDPAARILVLSDLRHV
jgi:16S rRNA (guanine527-N7)-methyltransferase